MGDCHRWGCVGNRYGNSAPMSTTLVTSHHIIRRESGCRPPHPCCLSIFNSSTALWGFLHFYSTEREKTTRVTSCRESWWCRKWGVKEENGDTYKPQMSVCFHMSGFDCGGNGSIWSLTHVKLKPFKPLNLHTHTICLIWKTLHSSLAQSLIHIIIRKIRRCTQGIRKRTNTLSISTKDASHLRV